MAGICSSAVAIEHGQAQQPPRRRRSMAQHQQRQRHGVDQSKTDLIRSRAPHADGATSSIRRGMCGTTRPAILLSDIPSNRNVSDTDAFTQPIGVTVTSDRPR